MSKGSWDVENVEVKGQAPEFTWGQAKCELKTYKSGQLAKLPREALTRADELRETTHIKVDELRKLPVSAAAKVESGDSVVPKVVRGAKSVVSDEKESKRANKTSVVPDETQNRRAKKSSVVSGGVEKRLSGSVSGHHFGPDELAKLGGGYLSLARELMGEAKLVATGRKVVTAEDLAVFLMLLRSFSKNMNADGSLPVARWREMWRALFGAGDVGRAWCHHRFARMRNFLSNEGWLSWESEDFVIGVYGENGRFIPGKAARWKAGEELMSMLEAVGVQEAGVGEGVEVLVIPSSNEFFLFE